MINITQNPNNEIAIPISGVANLTFTFAHHLSGKTVVLNKSNTNSALTFFSCLMDNTPFKYEGLYSFVCNDGTKDIYSSLAKVSGIHTEISTFDKNNKKDYELYK